MNDQDQHLRQFTSSSSTHNIPKRKPGCLYLEPRRHVGDRPFNHSSQVECITFFSPYPLEELSVCPRTRQGYSRRSSQITGSKVLTRSVLLRLAGQCGDGQESQWKVEDVCNFIDLNKACPKDSYPLSQIYVLVNSTARHHLLSFMDAFSGYNKIKLDEAN